MTYSYLKVITSTLLGLTLVACANKPLHSPKSRGFYQQGTPERYQVQRGDTVSKIAARYGLNWQEISRINRLDDKHTIRVGQWLTLIPESRRSPSSKAQPKPSLTVVRQSNIPSSTHGQQSNVPRPSVKAAPKVPLPTPATNTAMPPAGPTHTHAMQASSFGYPTQRRHNVARHFGTYANLNGNTIPSEGTWFVGHDNDPVWATQMGEVIRIAQTTTGYSIDILHEGGMTSNYFHVKDILVRQGQRVHKGEQIAKMKQQPSGMALLELRMTQHGHYVNPMMFLK